jgi:LysR family transcriptional regulator, glycine cleavage system transcriptional activator
MTYSRNSCEVMTVQPAKAHVERWFVTLLLLLGMRHNERMPSLPQTTAHTSLSMSRFPLDTLPGFIAAANALSFTQAASDLNLSQSAVSKQIKALETAVGVSLFKRSQNAGGRLELTEAGRDLYTSAVQSLSALEQTLTRIQRVATSTLSITTTPSLASLWLVPRLNEIKLGLAGSDVLLDARDDVLSLEAAGIDIAIRLSEHDLSGSGAQVIPLGFEQWVLVCSPSLIGGAAKLTALAQLSNYTLLAFDDSQKRFPLLSFDQWAAGLSSGVPTTVKPRDTVRFNHYEQVIRATVAGSGFAIGRKPLVNDYLKSGELIEPFKHLAGSTQESPMRYHLVLANTAMAKPATAAFIAWIEARL